MCLEHLVLGLKNNHIKQILLFFFQGNCDLQKAFVKPRQDITSECQFFDNNCRHLLSLRILRILLLSHFHMVVGCRDADLKYIFTWQAYRTSQCPPVYIQYRSKWQKYKNISETVIHVSRSTDCIIILILIIIIIIMIKVLHTLMYW